MSELHKILSERLAELGCEELPKSVRNRLASDLDVEVAEYARKRTRHITTAKVARAFRASFSSPKATSGTVEDE